MDHTLWKDYLKIIHSGGIGNIEGWVKLDLTMPQMKVIMLLTHHGKLTVGNLAERLAVSLPNMTGIIERLVSQDFVEKVQSNADKRVFYVKLTNSAMEKLEGLNQAGFEQFAKLERVLTKRELDFIKLALNVLSDGLEKAKNL